MPASINRGVISAVRTSFDGQHADRHGGEQAADLPEPHRLALGDRAVVDPQRVACRSPP